jgi:hypothetical protein
VTQRLRIPALCGRGAISLSKAAARELTWGLVVVGGRPQWDARFRHIMLNSGGYSLVCLAFLTWALPVAVPTAGPQQWLPFQM